MDYMNKHIDLGGGDTRLHRLHEQTYRTNLVNCSENEDVKLFRISLRKSYKYIRT